VLYDIDGGKAELMAALGRRLAQDADLLPQFTERG
jgi:hypothetical protein